MGTGLGVELDVIHTGQLSIPRAYAVRPEGGLVGRLAGFVPPRARPSPCLAYVVRHPEAGVVLVDTGFHPDAVERVRKDFGIAMGVMFAGLRTADRPFDAQLRELEVDPEEVRCVLMTHFHVDHTSGMRLLPGAEFVCTKEEWAAATGRSAGRQGYVAHHLPPRGRVRTIDFARDGEPHGPFDRTLDLLGDGSIRLLSTPGHTPGHMSVLLRRAGGGPVLVAGDASYTVEGIRTQTLPLLTADDDQARRSLAELGEWAERNPGAPIVPSHDPDAWLDIGAR
jgi:glyoxylase-like metal-dependent hydrolase (beta-lactamase superfamily II)